MRISFALAALALVAGCSVVPRHAWNWKPHQPVAAAARTPEDTAVLTNRVAELQAQRNDIRARISAEPDIWARQDLYAQLHSVGRRLSPLERRLQGTGAH